MTCCSVQAVFYTLLLLSVPPPPVHQCMRHRLNHGNSPVDAESKNASSMCFRINRPLKRRYPYQSKLKPTVDGAKFGETYLPPPRGLSGGAIDVRRPECGRNVSTFHLTLAQPSAPPERACVNPRLDGARADGKGSMADGIEGLLRLPIRPRLLACSSALCEHCSSLIGVAEVDGGATGGCTSDVPLTGFRLNIVGSSLFGMRMSQLLSLLAVWSPQYDTAQAMCASGSPTPFTGDVAKR